LIVAPPVSIRTRSNPSNMIRNVPGNVNRRRTFVSPPSTTYWLAVT
jgi:hypothetical protein